MQSSPDRVAEAIRRARFSLRHFLQFCWWNPSPLLMGRHTVAVCDRLTRAVEDWRRGKSTFLLVAIPFRHGKSDIVSRALPAYFLGRNSDRQPDVIMSGYGASLIRGFSKRAQRIMRSDRYRALFPGVRPGGTIASWAVDGSSGTVTAVGLGGAITGKGGDLIVLDDYCKSREEAVSQKKRDKAWDAFRDDLFTRRGPASIVVVAATPWHVDDIRGRILKSMGGDGFPQFEELNFPARKAGPDGWDYLFPERFPREWYDSQRAVLGRQAAALLDCSPQIEGGNRFNPARVVVHRALDGWPTGREARGWDLASSAKERDGHDPDWTWGVRGLVRTVRLAGNVPKRELWIRSMVAIQAEAPARDALIRDTARADGPAVAQHVEAFGAYKDAYTSLKAALPGHSVRKSRLPGDKAAKLATLEPLFENGDVHVFAGGVSPSLLDMWKAQFAAFPDGAHDDAPDATAVLAHAFDSGGSRLL